MLDECRFVMELTDNKSVSDYIADRAFRFAVERGLQNIGEALRQLESNDPLVVQQITEYERIIHFRHVLVHGYDIVKPKVVWDVVTEKLPVLRRELEHLLQEKD